MTRSPPAGRAAVDATVTVLETARLRLRELAHTDVGPLASVFGDPAVMRFGGVRDATWIAGMIRELRERWYEEWGFGRWALVERDGGTLVGIAGLSRYPSRCGEDEAELGYRLVRAAWGRGYATEAARAILAHGLDTLGVPRVVAFVDPANTPSLAVVRKLGMRPAGEAMLPGYTYPDRRFVAAAGEEQRRTLTAPASPR